MPRKRREEITNPKIICALFGVFIVAFFFAGTFFVYFTGIRLALKNNQVKQSWEKVPCKILTLELEQYETSRSGTKGGTTTSYRVIAEYTYQYQGKQYTGDRFNLLGGGTGFRSLLDKDIDPIRSQKDPMCFVNPENPEEAILDPTLNWISIICTGFGSMCLLTSIFMTFKLYSGFKTGFK